MNILRNDLPALLAVTAVLALTLAVSPRAATASDLSSPATAGAELYFISPNNGESVAGTFTVRFGLKGMGVAPAGVERPGTGHHHLLINEPEIDKTQPLPANDQVVHFGMGQTETTITLPPGKHTLRLLLGNHLHVPHTPPVMSDSIEITVTKSEQDGSGKEDQDPGHHSNRDPGLSPVGQ